MVRLVKTRLEENVLQIPILLRAVILVIPKVPKDWENLKEDLKRINCHKILKRLWNLKDKGMFKELLVGVPNEYDNIVRVDGRRSNVPGPSPTLGSLRPSHQ